MDVCWTTCVHKDIAAYPFFVILIQSFLQIEHSKLTNSGFESEQLTPCMFVCSPNNCSQDFFKDEKQVLSKTCRISVECSVTLTIITFSFIANVIIGYMIHMPIIN